jgi:hypothetical protein
LFACKSFAESDAILCEFPLVATPMDRTLACSLCLVAFERKASDRIGVAPAVAIACRQSCGQELYCSKECEDKAWQSYHKRSCGCDLDAFRKFIWEAEGDGAKGAIRQVSLSFFSHLCVIKLAALTIAHAKYQKHQRQLLVGASAALFSEKGAKYLDKPELQERKIEPITTTSLDLYKLFPEFDALKPLISGWLTPSTAVKYLTVLKKCLKIEDGNFNADWYCWAYNRLDLNSFATYGLVDLGKQGKIHTLLGRYCNPLQSLINHNCQPNADLPSGPRQSLRALRKIEAGDQIFIDYCQGGDDKHKDDVNFRLLDLADRFQFRCHCELCTGQQSLVTKQTQEALKHLP